MKGNEIMDEICLASSEAARMANVRLRIVHDLNMTKPRNCVYSTTSEFDMIPANAIANYSVKFAEDVYYFYTTKDRVTAILGDIDSFHTLDVIYDRFQYEKQLWLAWAEGHVYRIMLESWNAEKRDWQLIKTFGNNYGISMTMTSIKRILESSALFGYPKADVICCNDELADEFSTE